MVPRRTRRAPATAKSWRAKKSGTDAGIVRCSVVESEGRWVRVPLCPSSAHVWYGQRSSATREVTSRSGRWKKILSEVVKQDRGGGYLPALEGNSWTSLQNAADGENCGERGQVLKQRVSSGSAGATYHASSVAQHDGHHDCGIV